MKILHAMIGCFVCGTLLLGFAARAADLPAPTVGKLTSLERRNVQTVLHWWHEVYEAHHVDSGPRYMSPSYIQHNPNVDAGRDGFLQIMGRMAQHPLRDTLYAPPSTIVAKDNMVVMMFERQDENPREPGKTYTHHWLEMVRVQDGLVAEHWDSAFMRDPATYNPQIIEPYVRWLKNQGLPVPPELQRQGPPNLPSAAPAALAAPGPGAADR